LRMRVMKCFCLIVLAYRHNCAHSEYSVYI
jgi:hypothetical protein